MENHNLLTAKQVTKILGLSRVTLWRYVKDGRFPAPVSLGPRRIAWRTAEVQAWLDALPVAGGAE